MGRAWALMADGVTEETAAQQAVRRRWRHLIIHLWQAQEPQERVNWPCLRMELSQRWAEAGTLAPGWGNDLVLLLRAPLASAALARADPDVEGLAWLRATLFRSVADAASPRQAFESGIGLQAMERAHEWQRRSRDRWYTLVVRVFYQWVTSGQLGSREGAPPLTLLLHRRWEQRHKRAIGERARWNWGRLWPRLESRMVRQDRREAAFWLAALARAPRFC